MDTSDLCCVAFQPEAHQSAHDAVNRIVGWTVDVVPAEGDEFCGVVRDLGTEESTGHDVAVVQVWNDKTDEADGELRRVPLYGTRFEVL